MSRIELTPIVELKDQVKGVGTLEEVQVIYNRVNTLPDPYNEFIVSVGAPMYLVTDSGDQVEMPTVFLNRLQSKPLRFLVDGLSQFISMRLYPWVVLPTIRPLVPESSIVLLGEPYLSLAPRLRRIVQHYGYQAALEEIQQFLLEQSARPSRDEQLLQTATKQIFAVHGQLPMTELAATCHLSTSQLERRFKQFTSMTPKQLSRLVRFGAVVESLLTNPNQSPNDLAFNFGYADQSHFIHDFKSFAGYTPGDYAQTVKQIITRRQLADFSQYEPTA
ncbi:MAG: AraC family transcriptional regulator [Anaerolineae bacterium]|nr:AraC family transcriptional regulator [Anaerolineae bacterium]